MNYNECLSVPTTVMARSFPSHKVVATVILLGLGKMLGPMNAL